MRIHRESLAMSQYTPLLTGGFDDEFLTVWCLFLGHDADMIECQNKQRISSAAYIVADLI
jgi:hypothetical protein